MSSAERWQEDTKSSQGRQGGADHRAAQRHAESDDDDNDSVRELCELFLRSYVSASTIPKNPSSSSPFSVAAVHTLVVEGPPRSGKRNAVLRAVDRLRRASAAQRRLVGGARCRCISIADLVRICAGDSADDVPPHHGTSVASVDVVLVPRLDLLMPRTPAGTSNENDQESSRSLREGAAASTAHMSLEAVIGESLRRNGVTSGAGTVTTISSSIHGGSSRGGGFPRPAAVVATGSSSTSSAAAMPLPALASQLLDHSDVDDAVVAWTSLWTTKALRPRGDVPCGSDGTSTESAAADHCVVVPPHVRNAAEDDDAEGRSPLQRLRDWVLEEQPLPAPADLGPRAAVRSPRVVWLIATALTAADTTTPCAASPLTAPSRHDAPQLHPLIRNHCDFVLPIVAAQAPRLQNDGRPSHHRDGGVAWRAPPRRGAADVVKGPSSPWTAVCGLDDLVSELRKLVLFQGYQRLSRQENGEIQTVTVPAHDIHRDYCELGVAPVAGVLLYGVPGTGKTLIAKTLAQELGPSSFVYLSIAGLMQGEVGESERALNDAFQRAVEQAPSVIFLDELQAVFARRGRGAGDDERGSTTFHDDRLIAALLCNIDKCRIDRLRSSSRPSWVAVRGGVVVLGATNVPGMLDPALLSPGRLDVQFHVPPPTREAIRGYIVRQLRDVWGWRHPHQVDGGFAEADRDDASGPRPPPSCAPTNGDVVLGSLMRRIDGGIDGAEASADRVALDPLQPSAARLPARSTQYCWTLADVANAINQIGLSAAFSSYGGGGSRGGDGSTAGSTAGAVGPRDEACHGGSPLAATNDSEEQHHIAAAESPFSLQRFVNADRSLESYRLIERVVFGGRGSVEDGGGCGDEGIQPAATADMVRRIAEWALIGDSPFPPVAATHR